MFDRRQSTHPGKVGGMAMNMGHDHNMGSGSSMDGASDECYMDMLGNWRVTNVCVLTSSWHIKTTAQFVGTCIGVFFLVFLIEAIRRWGREWDRYIVRKAFQDRLALRLARKQALLHHSSGASSAGSRRSLDDEDDPSNNNDVRQVQAPLSKNRALAKIESAFFGVPVSASAASSAINQTRFRPTVMQQFIRSLVYAVQFTGAYIVMLIAMSFNGYILIAIILGGFAGHFVSTWDNLSRVVNDEDDNEDSILLFGSTGNSGAGALAAEQKDIQNRRASQVQAEKRALRYDDAADMAYGSGACCG
ncbi:hypothetical protein CF319_g4746 [Tilletia indica]|nr:hypothetical protein CF319_g4746 [Tilletia indica]